MKSLKIKTTAYTYLPHLEFPQYFINVTHGILSHPDVFQNLPVEPQVLIDAGILMKETTGNAVQGGQKERNARDLQRIVCESYLNKLGNSVLLRASMESTEEKQVAIVNLSKLTPVKFTRTRSISIKELQVQIKSVNPTGKKGEVLVKWKRIPAGITSYEVLTTFTDPGSNDTVWHRRGITSRCSILVDGLPELTRLFVRVIAHGYDQSATIPSNPVMCVAM